MITNLIQKVWVPEGRSLEDILQIRRTPKETMVIESIPFRIRKDRFHKQEIQIEIRMSHPSDVLGPRLRNLIANEDAPMISFTDVEELLLPLIGIIPGTFTSKQITEWSQKWTPFKIDNKTLFCSKEVAHWIINNINPDSDSSESYEPTDNP